ncbi:dihydropteroate synthase [Neptunomonas concharum]|uniref:Dihydropteroate synthase n=2 Tax=Neptunomonas concharum TaxID=1031538 RepID=A0A5P1RHL3_9GAMM|nr:dihydropteroate synthase [Neptunomonas concharum]
MGILNVTPDSFSDGGNLYSKSQLSVDRALVKAAEMVDEGATLIDVGGESTRPGAQTVSLQEELDRVLPVVEVLNKELDIVISVDSSSAQVITEAASHGAGLINDVRALTRSGALAAAVEVGLPVCLMHMQGNPETMQEHPEYENILPDVAAFLEARILACMQAGIPKDRIILDPGFGFGKTLEHNLTLLNRLEQLNTIGLPLMVGTSRKSMIAGVLDKEVDQRLAGGLATVAIAVMKGAKILRVHDIAETVDVVRMTESVMQEKRVSYE